VGLRRGRDLCHFAGCTKSRSVPCEVRDFNQLQGSSPSDGLSELGILGKRTVLLPVGLAFGFVAATETDCLPNHIGSGAAADAVSSRAF